MTTRRWQIHPTDNRWRKFILTKATPVFMLKIIRGSNKTPRIFTLITKGKQMKKILLLTFFCLSYATAQAKDIALPRPETSGGMPLMEAVAARRTHREFSPRRLETQTLSNLLWTAWGISSTDGKRTIPTARNQQNFDVYVLLDDGSYIYDAQNNQLRQIGDKDLRPLAATSQNFVKTAPLTLVFVAPKDTSGHNYAALHAGSAYQNVGLFCAAFGLNNVVRGLIDYDALHEALGLSAEQEVITSQTIGYPQ